MPAIDSIAFFATAPGATPVAVTFAAGDSGRIRTFQQPPHNAYLLSLWGDHQTAGYIQLLSPNLHEGSRGITVFDSASDIEPLEPKIAMNPLISNDLLTINLSGSAVAGDVETGIAMFYYDELPGISANLIDADELRARGGQIYVNENTLALGTAGGWSGAEAINAEFDVMKPNKYYALLGAAVSVECAAVAVRGIDTGNLRIAIPGKEDLKDMTVNWFVRLSETIRQLTGKPGKTIPVFWGGNKSAILLDGAQDENGADTLCNLFFQQLD